MIEVAQRIERTENTITTAVLRGATLTQARAEQGSVLVVDVGGAQFGHWGDGLALAAEQRGIRGLLIDGGVRDRNEQRDLGFPVFPPQQHPRHHQGLPRRAR